MPSLYPVVGKVYDSDGTTVLANVLVVFKNVTNNETQTQQTNSSGEFNFDAGNFTSGFSIGNEMSLTASHGEYYDEVVWTSSGSSKTQNLTLDTSIPTASLYCSVTDIRRSTGVDSTEFSDEAVYDMIKRCTNRIDELTGRTWKGIQTVTDEYYDGDDTDTLWLNNTDLQSVTAVSIDDDQDGTYTDVTTSYVHVYSEGYIILDRNAEFTSFIAAGPKSVKVSYTYGNQYPTEVVREVCILMVANLLDFDMQRDNLINKLIEKLKWKLSGLA